MLTLAMITSLTYCFIYVIYLTPSTVTVTRKILKNVTSDRKPHLEMSLITGAKAGIQFLTFIYWHEK